MKHPHRAPRARSLTPLLLLLPCAFAPPADAAPPNARTLASPEDASRLAASACAQVARAGVDADGEARRTSRVRWAAAVPRLQLHGRLGEGTFRRLDADTTYGGETLAASRMVEVRLGWNLDDLVYRSEELAEARFAAERRAEAERLRARCAEVAARWLRLRLDPIAEAAEERAAHTALDIVTAGELTRLEGSASRERSP